ncbi:YvrJ family protein [Paenibacillus sp. GCM10027628]|uniref:YvrJ family protein n=1 Tax=Paenibacillus sp. GCM10027628 TaxID=3273413 RepID=UPI0036320903
MINLDSTNLLTAISQVGFPIVLTGYLLMRFERKLEILTDTINKLTEVIIQNSGGSHGK